MRPDRFQLDYHLRNRMLDFRMVSHGPGKGERSLTLRGGNTLVQRALRQSVIDVGKAHQSPSEYGENEAIYPRAPSRHDAGDILVRNQRVLNNRFIAARGTHAENIPRFLDNVAAAIARHKRVDYLRMGG